MNGKKTNVHVVVDSADRCTYGLSNRPDGTINVVETHKTSNQIGAETGCKLRLSIRIARKRFSVNTGAIEATNQRGRKTTLRGGTYVAVNPQGHSRTPQKLLDIPQPSAACAIWKSFCRRNWFAASIP